MKKLRVKNEAASPERPDLYRYHDYRAFLRDWIEYQRGTRPGFSLRSLSTESGLALGYLSMVLSVARRLTAEALQKLGRPLGLGNGCRRAETDAIRSLIGL